MRQSFLSGSDAYVEKTLKEARKQFNKGCALTVSMVDNFQSEISVSATDMTCFSKQLTNNKIYFY